MSLQRVWNEGADPGQWEAAGAEDLPQDVLLHHAGRHAAATPHGVGSHDGEGWMATPLVSIPFHLLSASPPQQRGEGSTTLHTYISFPPSGPQVSANLKLSEKQEVKKELVSGTGQAWGQLPSVGLMNSGP